MFDEKFTHWLRTTARYIIEDLGVERATIAGGFFRDTMMCRPVKDVDVFVPTEGYTTENVNYEVLGSEDVEVDGVPINLVKVRSDTTAQGVLERMDIGLCQVGLEITADNYQQPLNAVKESLIMTPAFDYDLVNRTLTVTRPTRVNHLLRVMEKYPTHELLDPFDHLLDMADRAEGDAEALVLTEDAILAGIAASEPLDWLEYWGATP